MASVTKEFVLAGRAVFTLEVPDSFRTSYQQKNRVEVKPHYTFRVNYKPAQGEYKEAFFVQLLTGPDNTKSYSYLGMLDKNTGAVRTTAKSCRPDNDVSVTLLRRALNRVWADQVAEIEKAGFKLHHEGRCGRCGRALTTPDSVERGIGPECWEQMGGTVTKKADVSPVEHEVEARRRRIDDDIERVLAESEALERLQVQPGNYGEETPPVDVEDLSSKFAKVDFVPLGNGVVMPVEEDISFPFGANAPVNDRPAQATVPVQTVVAPKGESFVQCRLSGMTKEQLERTAQEMGVRIKAIHPKRNGQGFMLYGWYPRKMAH